MNKTIYIEKSDMPRQLLPSGYKGRKFKARVAESVHISSQQWDSESRDTYTVVHLATGQERPLTDSRPWPENMGAMGETAIEPGYAIREHSIFMGKDHGYTFHINPANASLLIASDDDALTADQEIVINYSCALKNTYGGRTNIRFHEAHREKGITAEQWETAKADLMASGHMRSNGSVTVKGRNARTDRHY